MRIPIQPFAVACVLIAQSLVAPGAVPVAEAKGSMPAVVALPEVEAKAAVEKAVEKMPLYFVENRGQLDSRVGYYLQGRRASVYFEPDGLTYRLANVAGPGSAPNR